jgi:hypothetical protein
MWKNNSKIHMTAKKFCFEDNLVADAFIRGQNVSFFTDRYFTVEPKE